MKLFPFFEKKTIYNKKYKHKPDQHNTVSPCNKIPDDANQSSMPLTTKI